MKRTTAEWQRLDRDHYLHPFTDHRQLHERGSRIITHAEGIYIYDSEGNRILDGMSGLWCVNIGYGRRELAEAAKAQMERLPYYNSFFQSAQPTAVELAGMLATLAPERLNRVFYTSSGSEANDTVVRMVRYYWELLGQPERSIIISRQNASHGSTMAGASLGGMDFMHAQGGLPIPGIEHIRQPYWFGEGREMDPGAFGLLAAKALEEKIQELGEHQVAAFIAEPIQGAGGVIIPPDSYWPEIKRICKQYGILLVVDEVICGFGRTGNWFGSETYDLEPDLMPIAKGLSSGYLPIGGVMISDRVARVLEEEGGEFAHGYTYSGHPVSCAVALKNLRLLQREKIVEKVHSETAPYLKQRWAELADHPLVGEARSLGLLAALELMKEKKTGERFDPEGVAGGLCRDICYDNGLVMRAVRDTMIVAPPLVITKAQIDELMEKVLRSLEMTQAALIRA
ncbi:MAG: aspartate aminotransferase family protein [Pseudomonadota bacterium]|nr:aspartate aminotransferase family protein [Pseudomonadota bacterium]